MENKNSNKSVIIIIVLVLLVVAGYYFYNKNKENRLLELNQKQTEDSKVEQDRDVYGATLQYSKYSNDPYQYYITDGGTYRNNKFLFEIQLQKNVNISVNTIDGRTSFWFSGPVGIIPTLNNFRILGITHGTSCEDGISVNVNGVSFIRTTEYGGWGGMESGSFDAVYCVSYNDLTYNLAFTEIYPRVGPDAYTPNETKLLNKFEEELKILDFKFIKK